MAELIGGNAGDQADRLKYLETLLSIHLWTQGIDRRSRQTKPYVTETFPHRSSVASAPDPAPPSLHYRYETTALAVTVA